MSETTGALAKALAAFQGDMPTVAKSKTATVKSDKASYSYTYAGLAEVSHVGLPLLSKHGLAFSCCPRRTESGHYELAAILMHESGEEKEGSLPISGGTPQALGSAITYARRYLFGSMTGLVTEDDDDGALASRSEQRAERRSTVDQDDPWAMDPNDPKPITDNTRKRMFALFGQKGIAEADQLPGINVMLEKSYTSRGDLTEADAQRVCTVVSRKPDAVPQTADSGVS